MGVGTRLFSIVTHNKNSQIVFAICNSFNKKTKLRSINYITYFSLPRVLICAGGCAERASAAIAFLYFYTLKDIAEARKISQ